MKDTDIAWAAGFFDGEGSISLRCQTGVRIRIGQKILNPLERFVKIFKLGEIAFCNDKYKGQRYPFYRVEINGEAARGILRLMLPYLTVKRIKALQALSLKYVYARDNKRIELISLLHSRGHSFARIGKMLNISRQRTHQIYLQKPQPQILDNHQFTYLNQFFSL